MTAGAGGDPSAMLTGRRVIVTGGGSGIGKAVGAMLATSGAGVMLVDRDDEVAAVAGEIAERGHAATHCVADVGDESAVERVVAQGVAELGGIDGLVTCAGITMPHAALDMTPDQFDAVLRVNLRGTYLCAAAVARQMVAAGVPGSMVTIASTTAFSGLALQAQYVASKAGVIALTKNLALEWGELGIRVNCVAPGLIDTPMATFRSPEQQVELARRTPLGRIGQPDDIARVVRFLLSDDAGYVTGQTLAVNGGASMPS